jgi:hypothetical protein
MVKKGAKIAKTAMYVRNNFSKIRNYSVHTDIDPKNFKAIAILVVMSVRNNIPYAHLSVRNIPKKSVRNILPKYSVRSTHPPHGHTVPVLFEMRNRIQNSFSDVLNWEQEKWEFFY